MRRRLMLSALLMAVVVVPFPGNSAPASSSSEVITGLSAYLSRDAVRPAEAFKVALRLTIGRDWHINANPASDELLIPTSVEFGGDSAPFQVLDIIYPEPRMLRLGFSRNDVAVYSESALIGALVRADIALKPGTYKLKGTVCWQACNDVSCLPPESRAFEMAIDVVGPERETHDAHAELFKGMVFAPAPDAR